MPKSNTPYDPQPERQDALGELAREGYQSVPGDHAARLTSLQDRLGLPSDSTVPTEAVVRSMRPRRWLAIAAGVAALVVAGIVLMTYDTPEQQVAMVVEATEQAEQLEVVTTADEVINYNDQQVVAVEPPIEEVTPETMGVSQAEKRQERAPRAQVSKEVVAEVESQKDSRAVVEKASANSSAARKKASKSVPSNTKALADAPAAPAPMANAPASIVDAEEEMSAEPVVTTTVEQDDVVAETSRFRMERAPTVETRQVTGEVMEPSGVPVIGATLTIEETGQQVVTDQLGEFSILLTAEAIVGDLTAPGYNTLMFDLTAGEEFRLLMPRISSSLPSAQLKGKSIGLRIIAPKGAVNAGFDTYVAQQTSSFSGETVTVQFEVNRFGRPRQITNGPGPQNRDAVKVVKDWLKNGPDWPESYQRESWRYTVVMP
ncbi:MAG: hypothetical protein AB8F78_12320 [Saprospiraceae bacterium]